jgi:recombination protein RecA
LRISVSRKDWIKKGDEPIGQIIRAKTIKNRLNNPYKVTEISLIFGEGIDQVVEAVDVGVDKGVIRQGGAWFNITTMSGEAEKFQGRSSVYDYYRENSNELAYLKSKLFEKPSNVIETPEEASEPTDD